MAVLHFSEEMMSDPHKVSNIQQEPVRLQHPRSLTHLVLLYISSFQTTELVLHLLNTFMHLWLQDWAIC